MSEPTPCAVYWSIYTDLRGREQFRKLYWDKLKDLIGRPAKLVGIEREESWQIGKPSHELRCHVWRYFSTDDLAQAVAETMRAAHRVATEWCVFTPPRTASPDDRDDELFVINWYRDAQGTHVAKLPLPKLTTIQISLNRDTGFRVRPGYTISGGGGRERPRQKSHVSPDRMQRCYTVTWHMKVQTSTKRELMEKHWPILQSRYGAGAEMVDLEKRSGDVGPFKFSIRNVWADVAGDTFVTAVLARSGRLHVSCECDETGSLVTMRGVRRHDGGPNAHQLMGFDARRC